MNPKAGEDGSRALSREETPSSREGQDGAPKSLRRWSLGARGWTATAAPVLSGRPGTPYLCAHGRSGPERRRGPGERGSPGGAAAGAEAARGELAGVSTRRPARLHWLARWRSLAPLKRRSHSWAHSSGQWEAAGQEAGGGGQSGSLAPPPASRRTTFQLESEGGGGGRVRRALELRRK